MSNFLEIGLARGSFIVQRYKFVGMETNKLVRRTPWESARTLETCFYSFNWGMSLLDQSLLIPGLTSPSEFFEWVDCFTNLEFYQPGWIGGWFSNWRSTEDVYESAATFYFSFLQPLTTSISDLHEDYFGKYKYEEQLLESTYNSIRWHTVPVYLTESPLRQANWGFVVRQISPFY